MSDGANFLSMPLTNLLVMCGYVPLAVVGIHDCTGHMVEWGERNTE